MHKRSLLNVAISIALFGTSSAALAAGSNANTMIDPTVPKLNAKEVFTVGETFTDTTGALNPTTAGDYTPPGILDGLGAYELDENTVRVFANHELLHFRGYPYEVSDGEGGAFEMTGARVSYFDFDKNSMRIKDAGLAYNTIYDANGEVASDLSFQPNGLQGFSRFCSSVLVEPHQFGPGRGIEDRIYFTGEEDGGFFNPVGGAEWALDVETGNLWAVPAMGRGAWENVTEIDSGDDEKVAFILADDSSPFDFDNDNVAEAAPLFLYVGTKDPSGDFLEQNGLRGGDLYVYVPDSDEGDSPLEFRGTGNMQTGTWKLVDNSRDERQASNDGSTGYDNYGYPTQGNLWLQAADLGAFGFSRPEDVAVNPANSMQLVLASTGVDTYDIDPATGDGADTFGTTYIIDVDVQALTAELDILYDGDDDPTRALRSPDNLDWADNGLIYIQEDEAEEDSLTGEPLFGPGAANPNEAGMVSIDPVTGDLVRIYNIDRSVVQDRSIANKNGAVDVDEGDAGEWETSGILDVSSLFHRKPGTLFLLDVQAHGIEDQDEFNPTSRIVDGDLVEGGQLVVLKATGNTKVKKTKRSKK